MFLFGFRQEAVQMRPEYMRRSPQPVISVADLPCAHSPGTTRHTSPAPASHMKGGVSQVTPPAAEAVTRESDRHLAPVQRHSRSRGPRVVSCHE